MLSQPKINLFVFLVELNRAESYVQRKLKVIKTNTLDIFGLFILSVKGKSTKLSFRKHSFKHYLKEEMKEVNINSIQFFVFFLKTQKLQD